MSWFDQAASAYGAYEGSKESASQGQQQQQPESSDSGGKMAGFGARDIGERVAQSLASANYTGDKYFGEAAIRGNPNLIQNSNVASYAVIAVIVLIALWLLVGGR